MKKGCQSFSAILLALITALSVSVPVMAEEETELVIGGSADVIVDESENSTFESNDWEMTVGGTADIDETAEISVFGGDTDESHISISNADVSEALIKAQAYLKSVTTNPVVATIGGEWSVMALARYGNLDASVKTQYMTNVYHTLDETNGVLSTNKYTEYERVAMALTAIGENPESIHGYDILHPLADYKKVKKQGINGSIFALIALDSNQYAMPKLTEDEIAQGKTQATRELYVQDILNKEISGGGWALSGKTPDPDITAMAIQSLTPYVEAMPKAAQAVERGVQKLSDLQNSNGGFESWDTENVESTAQTIIALSGLDVSLISSQRFIKNGHSLFDALLSFQNSDGSFSHIINGGADGMATDQATLALVAYDRAVNGKTRLYDMTDVWQSGGGDDETESQENIDAFKKKVEDLPKNPVIDDKEAVYALMTELDAMKKFEEKESLSALLASKLDVIEEQEKVVKALGDDIWKMIQPLKVTLADKAVVTQLMGRYEDLEKANQKHVAHAEDLLKADVIIKKLEKEMIPKEVFENVKNSGIDYTYEGKGYRIVLDGEKAYIPADMNGMITVSEKDGKLSFETAQKGKFPGEVFIVLDTSFDSDAYTLYKDDGSLKKIGWLAIENKQAALTLSEGGKYVICKDEETQKPENELTVSGGSVSGETHRKPSSGTVNKKKTQSVKKSNVTDVKPENGIIKAESLEKIKGEDKLLRIRGKLDDEKTYTLMIHGKDVKKAEDFKAGITLKSEHQNDIEKLSEKPLILHFEQKGDFPAEMLVEMQVSLDDGEYLLMRYNENERKAEYAEKVTVEDKKVKFVVSEGGDYFMTKRAKTKSVDEIEAALEAEKSAGESDTETENMAETKEMPETAVPENSEEAADYPYAPWIVLGVLAAAAVGAGVFILIKRKHKK